MKKIKICLSVIALVSIIALIFIRPQYIEQASKALIAIMECEKCFSE